MTRPSYRAPRPRSPYNNARRSRSPFRESRPKRRSISRSPSRSNSRSPSNASRRGLNDRLRSRSRSPPRDARAGDKRPRSSNHYQTTGHSDTRRFKVHYEKEKDDVHHNTGQASRGRTGGPDRSNTGRPTHQDKDHGRLSRGHDLPTRFDKERANARSALGSGELVRPSQQDPDSDKASPKAFSKGSSMSQPAHNQNHEAAHNTNGVPNPRYANLSDNCQSMRSRNVAERGSRHFRGRIRSMLTSVILVSMPKKPRTTSKQSLPLS
jgi:hypothetical protein